MTDCEKKLNDEWIEAHQRMIMHHRRAIIELSRRALLVPEICNECFDFEIINETGRSNKS
jgi:hypothetical protein